MSNEPHPNARTFEGPRGLQGYLMLETTPGNKTRIQLQESSAIIAGNQHASLGGPFMWLRIDDTDAHLHHTDARALRDALNVALAEPTTNTVPARSLRYTHLARQVSVTLDGKTYDGVLQGINRDPSQRATVHVLITSSDGAAVVGSLDLHPDHEVTIK